jgi:dihydrolipoamide dehydrogenase
VLDESQVDGRSYDVVVIGGGSGGAAAALRASQLGLKVLVIDRPPVGGTCVNVGCVPMKFLLRLAEFMKSHRELSSLGLVKSGGAIPDMGAFRSYRKSLAEMVVSYYLDQVFPSHGIDVVIGTGSLRGPTEVKVGKALVRARSIIIATGSRPLVPGSIRGLREAMDRGFAMTSDEAFDLAEVPESLVIVGGGAIGVEMAAAWHWLGSRVSIVEMMDRLLPGLDPELGQALQKVYAERGIDLYLSTSVTSLEPGSRRVRLSDGRELEASKVLVAVGRAPNIEELGLENAGVRYTRRGIEVDERCRTSVPNIYAVGDVTGLHYLASAAIAEGVVAAENVAGLDSKIDRSIVPMAVFSDPEVASVGVSAMRGDPRYRVVKFPNSVNYRAIALGEAVGFAKAVSEASTGRLVGFHMIGPLASEVVNAAAIAIRKGLTLEEAKGLVFAHPVVSESLLNALLLSSGVNLYLPRRG